MKYMEMFLNGLGFIFVVFGFCLPWIFFAGEPDLIDAIIAGWRKCGY